MESTAGFFSGSTTDATPVENDPADFMQAGEMSMKLGHFDMDLESIFAAARQFPNLALGEYPIYPGKTPTFLSGLSQLQLSEQAVILFSNNQTDLERSLTKRQKIWKYYPPSR